MHVSSSKTLPAGFSPPVLASHQLAEGGRKKAEGPPFSVASQPSARLLLAAPSVGPRALQFQVLASGKVIEVEIGCPPSPRENKNILIKAGKALGTIVLAPG